MGDDDNGTGKKPTWFDWTKHPILVLGLTTALTTLLVPIWTRQAERDKQVAELRLQHVRTTLQTSREVDRDLNQIITRFEGFKDDHQRASKIPTAAAREALKVQFDAHYAAFERNAWWWHWLALQDAKTLKLIDAEQEKTMSSACEKYQRNIHETVRVLKTLREAFIGGAGFPRGAQEWEANRKRLADLLTERQNIVQEIVKPVADAITH